METAAAANLPSILDTYWQVRCTSITQKQHLFDYADKCKVPTKIVPGFQESMRNDAGLVLCRLPLGIISCGGSSRLTTITSDQFKAMCDAYAAR